MMFGKGTKTVGLFLLCLGAASAGGCAVVHQMIAGDGPMVPPRFDGLKGKRVAVVCVVNSSSYGAETVADEIAEQVGHYLRSNIEDIDVVRREKVSDWIDNNNWRVGDFVEVGRAVNADFVIAIDIDSFRLHDGQTLYKGQANWTARVFDVAGGGKLVDDYSDPDYAFPKGHGISTTDRTEGKFRRIFVQQLAHTIAKQYYKHPFAEEFASDAAPYAH